MLKDSRCLVGNDSDRDDGTGTLIAFVIILMIIGAIISVIFYVGIAIGGYHSLKNYILAFKHNVIDSNDEPVTS